MSVTQSSAIVGVFRDRAIAEQAMDALYNAGFTHEQVRYSAPGSSGGFFEDLKSLFSGSSTDNGSVANDLTDMGLSDEEAHYYAAEHSNGNIILAVKAPGRGQEAQTIMQQYGALNAQTRTDSLQDTAQSVQHAQNGDTNPAAGTLDSLQDTAQPVQHTTEDTPLVAPSSDITIETTQPTTHENTLNSYQSQAQEGVTERAVNSHEIQPMMTNSIDESETAQHASANHNAEPQTTQASTFSDTQPMTHGYITEESQAVHAPDMQAIHVPEAQAAQPVVTEYNTEQQARQFSDNQLVQSNDTTQPLTNTTPHEQGTTTAQPVVGTVDHTDDLQSLQAQIASLQQQLQDAKAQLQAAKERETQVRTAREREQQLQALRQQIQEIQAELEATQAELRETHGRIGQYQ
ncbi:MAG: hypothetical protein NVS4B12_25960 [Ktedonobacteraceae bacterium]